MKRVLQDGNYNCHVRSIGIMGYISYESQVHLRLLWELSICVCQIELRTMVKEMGSEE